MASRTEIEDLLHCMICFDSYRNPKMLQCGHTFCEDCLTGYLQTYQQQRRAHSGKLPCPTCRELTSLPSNGVAGLRNDFKVKKIEEMFRTVNLRDRRNSKQICDSCRSQKKTVSSKAFCTSCSMSYCDSCLKKHDKNPIFKEHHAVAKNSENSVDVFCKVHQGEQVRYLCRACETVVCTLCIMNQHEGHDVIELTSLYKRQHEDIKNLQLTIESKMAKLKDKGGELEKLRHLNLKSCQAAEIAIKDKARELIEAVKAQEELLLNDLRNKRDEKLQLLVKELESVNFMVAKACSLQEFADATIKKNSIRLMAIHEELLQRMKTVAEIDTTIPDQNIQSILTFLPGRFDFKLGRIDEVQGSADELRGHDALIAPSPRRKKSSTSSSTVSHATGLAIAKAKLLWSINTMGSKVGEVTDPLGVACLLNGDIVVTEWGNKRVQVFDTVGKTVAVLGNGSIGPQGVTITLKGNVMVTDAQHKRLEVFTPLGQSLSKWGFGKFYGPCGIAVCPNGNCVVTDIAEHSVSIFQGEKKCLRRIGSRGSRNDQFDNPLYVATGRSSEIVVSDSDNHCIKVFDNMGNFLRKIGSEGSRDGQLRFPRGVAFDEDGNILVADRNNDRISLFTVNGGFMRHILSREDGIRDPYAIAVSSARNLVVTESGANRAAVKLFQL